MICAVIKEIKTGRRWEKGRSADVNRVDGETSLKR